MTISNPFGSFGFAPQSLGDLTQGVRAIQMAEAQKILRDKEIQRQELRDDEKWLLTQMPEQVDAMRTNMANRLSKEIDGFTSLQAKMMSQSKGKPLSLEQKMQIANETRRINALVGDEQSFIKQYQQVAPQYRAALQKATTQEEKDFINGKINELQKKILNPNYKPISLDLLDPLTPPPAPAYKTYEEIDKELMPKIKEAVRSVGGGKTAIDEAMAMDIIGKNLEGRGQSLMDLGQMSGSFGTKEERNKFFLDRLRGSIDLNKVGWQPKEESEKERVSGFEGRYKSAVNPNETSDAYVFDKVGSGIETSLTLPDGTVTNALMKPLAIKGNNGKVEGEFTINQKVQTPPMDYAAAKQMEVMTSGTVLPPDKNGQYTVSYNRPTKVTQEVPLSQDMVEKIKRKDPNAAKYIENLEPYPKRTGKAGEQTKADITEAEYAKLKKGDTYYFGGKEYKKQ